MIISKYIYDGFDWDFSNIETIQQITDLKNAESFFNEALALKPGLTVGQIQLEAKTYIIHFKIRRHKKLRLIRILKIRVTDKAQNTELWRWVKFEIRQ